mgnify:CR=1 FL=1
MLYNIYIYVYSVASLAGSDSAQFHVNSAKFVEKVKHLGKSLVLILQTSWQIWRKDIGYLGLSWVTRIAKEHGCHNQSCVAGLRFTGSDPKGKKTLICIWK